MYMYLYLYVYMYVGSHKSMCSSLLLPESYVYCFKVLVHEHFGINHGFICFSNSAPLC